MALFILNSFPLLVLLFSVGVRGFWIDLNQERYDRDEKLDRAAAGEAKGDSYSCFPWIVNPGR